MSVLQEIILVLNQHKMWPRQNFPTNNNQYRVNTPSWSYTSMLCLPVGAITLMWDPFVQITVRDYKLRRGRTYWSCWPSEEKTRPEAGRTALSCCAAASGSADKQTNNTQCYIYIITVFLNNWSISQLVLYFFITVYINVTFL